MNDIAIVSTVYLTAWSGGYDQTSYSGFIKQDDAIREAESLRQYADPDEADTIEVLRIDVLVNGAVETTRVHTVDLSIEVDEDED